MNTDPIVTAWAHALRAGTYPMTHTSSLRNSRDNVIHYGVYGVLCKVAGVEPEIGGTSTNRCPAEVRRLVTNKSATHIDFPAGLRAQEGEWLDTDLRGWGISQFTAPRTNGTRLTMAQVADLLDFFGMVRTSSSTGPLRVPIAA